MRCCTWSCRCWRWRWCFYTLGAPFAAALEVIIYAGAIVVLFVFVVMMLNLGPAAVAQERRWLTPGMWLGPALLSLVLLGEMVALLGGLGAGLRQCAADRRRARSARCCSARICWRSSSRRCCCWPGWSARVSPGPPRARGRNRRDRAAARMGLGLAAVLLAIGMVGVLVRRNVIFILMSLEIMLNAAGLAVVAAGARWAQADGQVLFILRAGARRGRGLRRAGPAAAPAPALRNARRRRASARCGADMLGGSGWSRPAAAGLRGTGAQRRDGCRRGPFARSARARWRCPRWSRWRSAASFVLDPPPGDLRAAAVALDRRRRLRLRASRSISIRCRC